ncbi:RNA polymerase subunit sigma-70 [Sphingopyxis granuli]|uniref:RNA polymerase subunit sigma-70 n=1 Tax=Sphingopyxis granuli TaxID=267128 RepID=UPI001F532451|nr:RNA polymerase subunit sigma-70 [Sphingopyxis granuli]UNK79653.1 RNA polymerase subunit sigma-70 [Sphingopyxis granuli]
MSAKSEAIERAAEALIAARTEGEAAPGPRTRAGVDRAFARLMMLAAPRIRYFIRAHGLSDVAEDAEQACAIALHCAIGRYDPRRACFATYMAWPIRAELQALRQRLRGGQRGGSARAGVPLSLDALAGEGADGWLADPQAEAATERAAADRLADAAADRLVAAWSARRRLAPGARAPHRTDARLAAEEALVRRHLLPVETGPRLCESDRHIVRRALADIARHAAAG